MMWFVLWLAFVMVCVGGPLVFAQWRETRVVDEVDPLPEPRGRQRPAPDKVEEHDLLTARLRLFAGTAAVFAAGWLVLALLRWPVDVGG